MTDVTTELAKLTASTTELTNTVVGKYAALDSKVAAAGDSAADAASSAIDAANAASSTIDTIVLETNKSRGFRVVGAFVDGFTYELFNDVGIDEEGNSWIYKGDGKPHKVVSAGTVPSADDGYEQVTNGTASAVATDSGQSVQEELDDSSSLIRSNLIAQGLSGNYGFFADGLTYANEGDVGITSDNKIWAYVGAGAPNKVVAAGTVPSVGTGYEKVAFNSASAVLTNTSETVQSFIDSFALKIFQSPTNGGLTEIQTRTVDAGEVYEVRKTSDDSLATICSNATGTTEIVQNGTDNKSGGDGVVEFFVADGGYYVEVGGVRADFKTLAASNVRQAIEAVYKAQGFNNVFFFEDGFTYAESNDVGIYEDGTAWTYVDSGALPVTVAAGTVPGVPEYSLYSEINDLSKPYIFATVGEFKDSSINFKLGQSIKTLNYYDDKNGGGANYIIKQGVMPTHTSYAGSFQITDDSYAYLCVPFSVDLRIFGARMHDNSTEALTVNDAALTDAIKRTRAGFGEILVHGKYYHKKPIVIEHYQAMRGASVNGDHFYTPIFEKVGNETSGILPLEWLTSGFSDAYDVDASLIIKRQTTGTTHCQGINLSGIEFISKDSSRYGVYVPRIGNSHFKGVTFRGHITSVYFNDMYKAKWVMCFFNGVTDQDSIQEGLRNKSCGFYGEYTPTHGTPSAGSTISLDSCGFNVFARAILGYGLNYQSSNCSYEAIMPIGTTKSKVIELYDNSNLNMFMDSVEGSKARLIELHESVATVRIKGTYNIHTPVDKLHYLVDSKSTLAFHDTIFKPYGVTHGVIQSGKFIVGAGCEIPDYTSTNINNIQDFRFSKFQVTYSEQSTYEAGDDIKLLQVVGNSTHWDGTTHYIVGEAGTRTLSLKGLLSSGQVSLFVNNRNILQLSPTTSETEVMINLNIGDDVYLKCTIDANISRQSSIFVNIY